MSETQRDNYDQDNISTNLFDNMPLFEQNDQSHSQIIINNSLSKITNLFSFISKKILEIKENNLEENSLEFSQNFKELKENQIELINNSIYIKDLNYIFLIKLLHSLLILYNFINDIFLEKYINIKYNDIYDILKNITDNIFSNYNLLVDIVFKLSEKMEKMNEEINILNNQIIKKEKHIKQFMDKNNLLNEKLNLKQKENKFITNKLLENKLNKYNNNNSYYANNKYTINALKNKIYNNSIDNSYRNKILNKNNISNRNSSRNLLNNSNLQYLSITNLYLKGNRAFTPKIFKELIYNIYEAKESFNKKCLENKQPKETLEQFIYTYFNYKYGLKNMVIEWTTNIINGIKNYSLIDSEIRLFGKIMRNELDEDSRLIMPQIKKKVNEIFMNILRREFSFKNEDDIIEQKKKIIKNRLPLNIVQMILNSLYSKEEKENIIKKINISVNEYKYKISKNENKINNSILYNLICKNNKDNSYHQKFTRVEINQKIKEKENELNTIDYNTLLEIIHEFQIMKREKYLKPFVKLFKSVDEDSDGILNESQFINLVKLMNIFDEKNFKIELDNLLNAIDPYDNKKIIFTDCVTLFSYNNKDGESIMDTIYNNSDNYSKDVGDNKENIENINYKNIINNENLSYSKISEN